MDPITSQPQDIPPKQKTFTPKFIAVIVLLLVVGGGAAAGIWYWQTNQIPATAPLPVHKAIVDPTADWKTYTNTQYGFEFKYPPTLLIGLEGTGSFYSISILEPSQTAANSLVTFEVEPNGNPKNLPLNEWYSEQLQAFKLTPEQLPKTDIIVGGKPAIRLDYSSTGKSEFHVIVLMNKTDLLHINYPKPPTKFDIDFDQILSNFKFTTANTPIQPAAGQGTLSGHVDIGPICPVEQAGNPCKPTPEMYQSQQVTVYGSDSKTVVIQKNLDALGNFSFNLDAGNYFLSVSPAGIMKDSMHPAAVTAGKTTTVDISIDTGIR